jgi:hypothetical protein
MANRSEAIGQMSDSGSYIAWDLAARERKRNYARKAHRTSATQLRFDVKTYSSKLLKNKKGASSLARKSK